MEKKFNEKCTIIGIAGGTGSGKTTFTNRIKDAFPEQVTVIYHDNYYKSQDTLSFEERQNINYDHPDQLDTDMLIKHILQLKAGYEIGCPVYDYILHTRSNKTILIKPSPIILIEGILIFCDENLRKLIDIKIFVETDADERILRRVQRDIEERGRDINGIIIQYLSTVKPMHNLYVEPTKALADIIINGGMNDIAFDIIKTKIEMILRKQLGGANSEMKL